MTLTTYDDAHAATQWKFGDFILDVRTRSLSSGDKSIKLEPKPFCLLMLMVTKGDGVVSKDELLEHVWGGRIVSETAVTQCVSRLRKALGDKEGAIIVNAHGVGYQMGIPVLPLLPIPNAPPDSDDASELVETVLETGAPSTLVQQKKNELRQPLVMGSVSFLLVLCGFLAFHSLNTESTESTESTEVTPPRSLSTIAVLPFADLGAPNDSSQYLADGIQDSVLTHLSKLDGLQVISRTTMDRYRDINISIKELGKRLNVDHVLEGSVQRNGTRLRINAQLINAATDHHEWADIFDGDLLDIFNIQERVAQSVTDQMGAITSHPAPALALSAPTKAPNAYLAYLKAREEVRKDGASRESLFRAQNLLERAIAEDDTFALAHAELSRIHSFIYWFSYDASDSRRNQARDSINLALKLAPDLPEAHMALGIYRSAGFNDILGALEAYQRAAELNPHSSQIKHYVAGAHRRLGQWSKALELMEASLQDDPENILLIEDLANLLRGMRLYSRADALYQRISKLEPNDVFRKVNYAMFRADVYAELDQLSQTLASIPKDQDPGQMVSYARYLEAFWSQKYSAAAGHIEYYPRNWLPGPGGVGRVPKSISQGLVAGLNNQNTQAKRFMRSALIDLETEIHSRPNDAGLAAAQAMAYAVLNDKKAMLVHARRALDLTPPAHNPVLYPEIATQIAMTYAYAGDSARSFELLNRLMRLPYGFNPVLVKWHPVWLKLSDTPEYRNFVNKWASIKT